MHIAALVLGIVGLLVSLIPLLGMYALPLTGLALIFGVVTLKKKKGMAIAGIALGAIGTVLGAYQFNLYLKAKDAVAQAWDEEMKKSPSATDPNLLNSNDNTPVTATKPAP